MIAIETSKKIVDMLIDNNIIKSEKEVLVAFCKIEEILEKEQVEKNE